MTESVSKISADKENAADGSRNSEAAQTTARAVPELYARAGINDLAEFYATKFASTEILDPRYFRPLDRFDMHFARTLWVYDNVRAGSTLLDLGCGVGMLALLKRKRIHLAGVEISEPCAAAARRNGYDDVRLAELTALPFPDASFDYVASLDVLGHIAFEEKDKVLCEIKRVLKPDGVTMHGIECTDQFTHKSYDEMTTDELRRFIAVDGHVGLERAEAHAARFQKFFAHVAFEPRYVLCLSSEEFLKQADKYGLPFEADFLDYLRGLSQRERRAFDMAMGYVFNKISDLNIKLPASGLYTFLKASNAPLGAFYNEHRDRSALIADCTRLIADCESEETKADEDKDSRAALDEQSSDEMQMRCLDRAPSFDAPFPAEFDEGWHAPDDFPPVARWMREAARVRFAARSLKSLRLDLTTHIPDLSGARPVELRFFLNGVQLARFSLFRYGWLELKFDLPEILQHAPHNVYELTIRANRTFQPRPDDAENRDDRELSIAVCNIQIESQVSSPKSQV
jgi:SAM-dependent methyltransferase